MGEIFFEGVVIQSLTIYRAVLQWIQKVIGVKRLVAITFKFNRTKAIEALLYLVSKLPNPDVYTICKILYIVDKRSLERYGRFIFGESYVAMQGGATPSNVYNLITRIRKSPTNELKIEGDNIVGLRQADLDYFSISDVECLDYAINKFGKESDWPSRRDESHDEAYREAWNRRGKKGSIKIPIESIARALKNSDELMDYLLNSG